MSLKPTNVWIMVSLNTIIDNDFKRSNNKVYGNEKDAIEDAIFRNTHFAEDNIVVRTEIKQYIMIN